MRLERDRNNTILMAKIHQVLGIPMEFTDDEFDAIYNAMDANLDSIVTRQEFHAFASQTRSLLLRNRTFCANDRAVILKEGTHQGEGCVVVDPTWTDDMVKVRMGSGDIKTYRKAQLKKVSDQTNFEKGDYVLYRNNTGARVPATVTEGVNAEQLVKVRTSTRSSPPPLSAVLAFAAAEDWDDHF